MTRATLLGRTAIAVTVVSCAAEDASPPPGQDGGVVAGSGGSSTAGVSGAAGTGGAVGSGGSNASGGSSGMATGGLSGAAGDGGAIDSGGSNASGGNAGSGGSAGSTDCTPPQPGSMGNNPLFTDTFTADPAPMVHNCTFYIACGHDEGTTGFFLREWYLLSSTDMVNWERKVAFGVNLFAWANANAWASQMVEKNGRFYWYVPVQKRNNGTMAIGVATANSPEGPFTDAIGGPLVDDQFEMSNMGFATPAATPFTIDPTVFVDDDGRAYLHYGSFFRMINSELDDDMISIKGTMKESTPQGFFEAPFLTKRNGVYYEVYARDGNPAKIDYATSNSPLGPWQYRGRILDPLPNNPGEDAATSHPGIAEFAGQWYLVYHLSNGSAGTYRRQVAMEKLTFNADGSIQKVTPSSGLRF
jgi:beta-xylosidase